MKRKVLEGTRLKECAPEALTLPSLSVNNYNIKVIMRKKKHNLRLITDGSSSVNKENNRDANKDRPLTATLEKPQILDIKFISKIDMSLVKKEFLSITNLCRTPLTIIKVLEKTGHCERPLSLPNCDKNVNIPKLSKRSKTTQSVNNGKMKPITSETSSKKISIPRTVPIYKKKKNTNDNNNNDAKFSKIDRRKTTGVSKELIKLPGPCTTCGRPDHPERFHSHPLTPTSSTKTMCESEKVPSKITVQKPTGMKYKSKIDDIKSGENVGTDDSSSRASRSSSGRRPRTLMCYLCGREFGTASLPLHEPKCLEKWHRENSSLPSSQQRKPPAKPDVPMSSDKWNQYAWEMCQASLVPCHNCGRTFFPDRLIVHQRGCKNSTVPNKNMMEIKPRTASAPPNSVSCPKCGRLFGSKSIKFHEARCTAKDTNQNEKQPYSLRTDFANGVKPLTSGDNSKRPISARKPNIIPCYLCGRLFSVSSIPIHEPQCLKKWKIENDQLPLSKRQKEPVKPLVKLTGNDHTDLEVINEAYWDSHIHNLVPCGKCGRTFTPHRITTHERCCKGYIK